MSSRCPLYTTALYSDALPSQILANSKQTGTNVATWGIVLYLIYKVQLANELAARKSFLRLLDKNRELMRAEEDKRVLADDVRKLEADNERIRKEVAVSGMNEMQVQLVQVRPAVRCMSKFSDSSSSSPIACHPCVTLKQKGKRVGH